MELKIAKEVLEGMDFDVFTAQELTRGPAKYRPFISVHHGISISMDKALTDPCHLEAIATWMRDPEGVVKA